MKSKKNKSKLLIPSRGKRSAAKHFKKQLELYENHTFSADNGSIMRASEYIYAVVKEELSKEVESDTKSIIISYGVKGTIENILSNLIHAVRSNQNRKKEASIDSEELKTHKKLQKYYKKLVEEEDKKIKSANKGCNGVEQYCNTCSQPLGYKRTKREIREAKIKKIARAERDDDDDDR